MLTQLYINNLATIKQIDIQFKPGMSVLTGETGAGKSILIDALSLALGERAKRHLIRPGCDHCEITLCLDVSTSPVIKQWLSDKHLADDNDCIIRRIINDAGRSQAFINQQRVGLQSLRELGAYLIEIHGQHAHHSLLNAETHQQLLDEFGEHSQLTHAVKQAYQQWRQIKTALATRAAQNADNHARISLLRYQIDELEALELNTNEWSTLTDEHQRLAAREQILQHSQHVQDLLSSETQTSLLEGLAQAKSHLSQALATDKSLAAIHDLLAQGEINLREASSDLSHYMDQLVFDPMRFNWLDKRLETLHDYARKHHIKPEQLPAHLAHLTETLHHLESHQTEADELDAKLEHAAEQYQQACAILSKQRKRTAKAFNTTVTTYMQKLGMQNSRFTAMLTALPADQLTATGQEQVKFLVTTNPDHPLRPLSEVASGGELSRISLAIEVANRQHMLKPILVFDEVDVGIGGETAEVVGKLLCTLAEHSQVLCVTHLPQVAVQADQHLRIAKTLQNKSTYTQIETLTATQKVDEIARMLGGVKITAQTRKHAQELIQEHA